MLLNISFLLLFIDSIVYTLTLLYAAIPIQVGFLSSNLMGSQLNLLHSTNNLYHFHKTTTAIGSHIVLRTHSHRKREITPKKKLHSPSNIVNSLESVTFQKFYPDALVRATPAALCVRSCPRASRAAASTRSVLDPSLTLLLLW